MSVTSRLIGWIFKLPPAETHDVVVERDLKVPMPDGVVLLADHYYPRGRGPPPPGRATSASSSGRSPPRRGRS